MFLGQGGAEFVDSARLDAVLLLRHPHLPCQRHLLGLGGAEFSDPAPLDEVLLLRL
jgi:hypothetical protein